MATERWKIGDVSITKVEELAFWSSLEFLDHVLSTSTHKEIEAIKWLQPSYMKDGQVQMSIHSFLVETPTMRLVIDTGVGNHKVRTGEMFNGFQTDYLERLSQIWDPAEVDGVLCTHLHIDHVGWNTKLVDGSWVPTFPNASYYFVRQEYAFWKSYAETQGASAPYSEWARELIDGIAVFEDSVRPVADAGLVSLVEPDSTLTPEISLIPTFGHTLGHVAVRIDSKGESAVITGDLMHFPCQVARPDWSDTLDFDDHTSAETRHAFVERFADTSTLVLGTHFGSPTGGHIVSDGDSFKMIPVG